MLPKRKLFTGIALWFTATLFYSCVTVSADGVHSPEGTTTTFILVRHAERNDQKGESALRPEGRERAQDLVKAIGEMGITAIYTPDRGRNIETVQPLADHLELKLTIIPEKRLANTRKFADEFVKEALAQHAGGGDLVGWQRIAGGHLGR